MNNYQRFPQPMTIDPVFLAAREEYLSLYSVAPKQQTAVFPVESTPNTIISESPAQATDDDCADEDSYLYESDFYEKYFDKEAYDRSEDNSYNPSTSALRVPQRSGLQLSILNGPPLSQLPLPPRMPSKIVNFNNSSTRLPAIARKSTPHTTPSASGQVPQIPLSGPGPSSRPGPPTSQLAPETEPLLWRPRPMDSIRGTASFMGLSNRLSCEVI